MKLGFFRMFHSKHPGTLTTPFLGTETPLNYPNMRPEFAKRGSNMTAFMAQKMVSVALQEIKNEPFEVCKKVSSVDRVQWGLDPPGDVHEDRRKTFLNRVGSPAISLKTWRYEA